MDKASDSGSEDWGFESLRGRLFLVRQETESVFIWPLKADLEKKTWNGTSVLKKPN